MRYGKPLISRRHVFQVLNTRSINQIDILEQGAQVRQMRKIQ